MKNPPGFTLVELLAVISILGILAAIIIPVVGNVRISARRAACASNLRQLGAGMFLYAGENKGRFPHGYWVGAENRTWDVCIAPYVNSSHKGVNIDPPNVAVPLFLCPADTVPSSNAARVRRSYSMVRGSDGFGNSSSSSAVAPATRRISDIPAPSRTIILTERAQANNWLGADDCAVIDHPAGQTGTANNGLGPHLHDGVFNYLFADGHVKTLRPEDTLGPAGTMTVPGGMWTIGMDDD